MIKKPKLCIKGKVTTPKNISKVEMARGIKTELEHTKNKMIAKKIALDHLKEDKKYYIKLKKARL